MKMKCECGKEMREIESEFKGFKIKGWSCECGEELLDPVQVNAVLKLRKLIKEGIRARVGRVGNNLVVRLPKAIESVCNIKEGDLVSIEPSDSVLVVGLKH